jgi:hypothetical protein
MAIVRATTEYAAMSQGAPTSGNCFQSSFRQEGTMSGDEGKIAYGVGHTAPLSDDLTEFTDFLAELNKEPERGAAAAAAAFVDELLRRILKAFLVQTKSATTLLTHGGPLSEFGARINACHGHG